VVSLRQGPGSHPGGGVYLGGKPTSGRVTTAGSVPRLSAAGGSILKPDDKVVLRGASTAHSQRRDHCLRILRRCWNTSAARSPPGRTMVSRTSPLPALRPLSHAHRGRTSSPTAQTLDAANSYPQILKLGCWDCIRVHAALTERTTQLWRHLAHGTGSVVLGTPAAAIEEIVCKELTNRAISCNLPRSKRFQHQKAKEL
jgi:hypothetical protein